MMQATDLYNLDLHVRFITAKHIVCSPHWKIDGYILPFNKLYFITDGSCVLEMDGKTYRLRRGDMALIPRGKKHSMRYTEKKHLEKFFLHFTLELPGGINFFDTPDFADSAPVVSCAGDFDSVFSVFSNLFSNHSVRNRLALLTHLHAATLSAVSLYIDKKMAVMHDGNVSFSEVIALMQSTPGGLQLKTLADMMFLSPEHFVRKFKAFYGISPMKYYDRLRIDHATAAIREGQLSLAEIAESLGISDPAYFSKFFKKHVGISPGEYRRTCHKKYVMFAEGREVSDS
ncbi:MAG: helix-turn-helix domain-containing protein [Clostridia bacterium]|nr:helix-turn-helix domain-containing protein [Oscillospiraceae bacterium]MBQ7033186.1 helix-turn-helix domain-containing protein [Clostridia bacterium]